LTFAASPTTTQTNFFGSKAARAAASSYWAVMARYFCVTVS
jgi:hypothetical protein